MPVLEEIQVVLRLVDRLQERLVQVRADLYHKLIRHARPGESLPLLVCRSAGTEFGIPLDDVEIVTLACTLAPLPGAPRWVVGQLNLRGTQLPIIDVSIRLGQDPQPITMSDMIVIVREGKQRAGLLVQSVSEVKQGVKFVPATDVHRLPHATFLAGMAQVSDVPIPLFAAGQLIVDHSPAESGS